MPQEYTSASAPRLFCILDDGGRNLLTRAQGKIQMPSFPTIGLLCTISTYSDRAGFGIEGLSTGNVLISYKRFENHLMFVLATSNLLATAEQLHGFLQLLYDGIVLLLGLPAMSLDNASKIDFLRKKLRGLSLIDILLADDSLVPCLMLPCPQTMGLPLSDRADMVEALQEVATAAGTTYAAVVRQGHYLAATPDWWDLQPKETLLLQHLGTHAPEASSMDVPVYLSARKQAQPMRFLATQIEEGVQLLLLCGESVDLDELQLPIDNLVVKVSHIITVPIWCSPPVAQFATLVFDLAIVLQHQPGLITLFWGRSNLSPLGFNPFMSPTLRRQLASPSMSFGGIKSMSVLQREAGTGADNLQLYFRSCVDLLLSFLVHNCDAFGTAPDAFVKARAALGQSAPSASGAVSQPPTPTSPAQRLLNTLALASLNQAGAAASSSAAAAAAMDEVHLVSRSNRLVALIDTQRQGHSVFLCLPKSTSRQEAVSTAKKLKSSFCTSYMTDTE